MTTIDKLGVSGIRSFEPQHEVTIRFLKPLTIILGHNGAGKTTIIECIKMACTGDLPPFTDKGGAFVHDPKISSSTETKAKIRLQFTDLGGRKIVVNRQFQVTNKANKKQEFKTIEQSLQYTNENGERQTVSHRCNDVNKAVPELMGVSKAILENVIFAHQEESLWPLADGKKLKEKFDDIFASTRYTKALEAIRKQRKEYSIVIRERKAELALWKDRMERAEQIKRECDAVEEEMKRLKETVRSIEAEMVRVQEDLKQAGEKVLAVNRVRDRIRQVEAQKAAKLETKASLYEELEAELEDSDEELQKWMSQANDKLKSLKTARTERQTEIKTLQVKVHELIQQQKETAAEKGKMDAEADIHRQNVVDMQTLKKQLLETGSDYGEAMGSQHVTELESDDVWCSAFEKLCASIEASLNAELEKNRAEESRAGNEVNRVGLEVEQMEKTIKETMEEALERRKMAHAKKGGELDSFTDDPEASLEVERDREKRAYEALKKQESQNKSEDFQTRYSEKQKEVQVLRRKIAALHDERKTYGQEEDARVRVQLLREQLSEKAHTMNAKESQLRSSAELVLGSSGVLNGNNLQESISATVLELMNSLSTAESDLAQKRSLLSGKEAEMKIFDDRISAMQSALKEKEAKLEEASGGRWSLNNRVAFDEELKKLVKSSQQLLEESQTLKYGAEFIGSMVERGKQSQCCPTCDRGFQAQGELDALMAKLTKRREKNMGSKLKEKEMQADAEAQKVHQLQELVPLWDELGRVEAEKNEAEATRSTVGVDAVCLKEQLERVENEVTMSLSRRDEVEELKRLAQEFGALQREHVRIERDVDLEARKLRQSDDGKDLVSIDEQLSELHEESDKLALEAERIQRQRDVNMRKLSAMDASYREQRERVLNLETEVEKRKRVRAEVAEMLSTASKLEAQSKETASQLPELKARFNALQRDCNLRTEESMKRETVLRQRMNALQAQQTRFTGLRRKIEGFTAAGRSMDVETLQQKLKDTDVLLDATRQKISALETSDSTDAEAAMQFEGMLRNISENVRYRKVLSDMEAIDENLFELCKEEEEALQGKDVEAEHRKLEENWNRMNGNRHSAEGKAEGVQHRHQALAADLDRANAQGSGKEYRRLLTQLKTIELASADLEKYHRALDQALMTYHTLKMSEINKTIKELWQTTYQGTDIDYIEIVSDVDSANESGKVQSAKRSYNYRVVMRRGDALLDMRGRCSAGQKVLACLVIRLALADSFALDCGILALDEPTTNLDRRNMEKLAASLADIIHHRRRQANFQLVLITHDEEFIELLGSREICDSYYLVYKDDESYSRVKQQDLVAFH